MWHISLFDCFRQQQLQKQIQIPQFHGEVATNSHALVNDTGTAFICQISTHFSSCSFK